MKKNVELLTKEETDALRSIESGADVLSYSLAVTLRRIHNLHPQLLKIGKVQGEYLPLGQQPYFGAILTAKGKKAIA